MTNEKDLLFAFRYGKNPQTNDFFSEEDLEKIKNFAEFLGLLAEEQNLTKKEAKE